MVQDYSFSTVGEYVTYFRDNKDVIDNIVKERSEFSHKKFNDILVQTETSYFSNGTSLAKACIEADPSAKYKFYKGLNKNYPYQISAKNILSFLEIEKKTIDDYVPLNKKPMRAKGWEDNIPGSGDRFLKQ